MRTFSKGDRVRVNVPFADGRWVWMLGEVVSVSGDEIRVKTADKGVVVAPLETARDPFDGATVF